MPGGRGPGWVGQTAIVPKASLCPFPVNMSIAAKFLMPVCCRTEGRSAPASTSAAVTQQQSAPASHGSSVFANNQPWPSESWPSECWPVMSFVNQDDDGGQSQGEAAGRPNPEAARPAAGGRAAGRQYNDAESMEIHPALLEDGDWGLGTGDGGNEGAQPGPPTPQKRQVQVTLPDGTQTMASEVFSTEAPVDPEEVAAQLRALDEITVRARPTLVHLVDERDRLGWFKTAPSVSALLLLSSLSPLGTPTPLHPHCSPAPPLSFHCQKEHRACCCIQRSRRAT